MTMKSPLLVCFASLATTFSVYADSTLVLNGVHNCCKKCDNGIQDAITRVTGAAAKVEKGKVTITASDEKTAKQAAASLLQNGYFGEGAEGPAIADSKVKTVTISGLHLCCGKCVTAADTAIKSVTGVAKHNAEKGATAVVVEGDFSTQALNNALHKAGFHGSFQ